MSWLGVYYVCVRVYVYVHTCCNIYAFVCMFVRVRVNVYMSRIQRVMSHMLRSHVLIRIIPCGVAMGWLRVVGSSKL